MESLDIIYLNQSDRIYPKNNSLFSKGDIIYIYIYREREREREGIVITYMVTW